MISVIIPLYNKEHTILRTIKKVFEQTYKDFEVVVVDDGSTDNSVRVINDNVSESRLRIVHQENEGVSSARNKGAQEAKGEWLAFLDADDYWLPTYLEEMVQATQLYPDARIVGCASYVVNEQNGDVSTNRMIDRLYGKCEPLNYFLSPDIMSHIGASLIQRKEFLSAGGFRVGIKNNEDILLQGSMVMNGGYVYLGKMLHVYSIGIEGQATRNPNLRNKFMQDSLYVISEFFKMYESKPENNCVIQALCFRYRDFLIRHLKSSDYSCVSYFIDNVPEGFRKYTKCGAWMKQPACRNLAILYVLLTKILWHRHRIQSRNHHSKYESELKKSIKK